jgi:hypothetical protein
VVQVIVDLCRAAGLTARTEPADLAPDRDLRPDIQVDLPERTLLGDVTVRHPAAKMWRKDGASARGVVAVGDQVATQKQNKYAALARDLDMAFKPLVFYTYGGFHDSTMSFIKSVTRAIDPATSLISAVEWRETLLSALAIAVQRWTARIMIDAAQRLRAATFSSRIASACHSGTGKYRGRYSTWPSPRSHMPGPPVPSSSAAPGSSAVRLAAHLLGLTDKDDDALRDPDSVDVSPPAVRPAPVHSESVHTTVAPLTDTGVDTAPTPAPAPTAELRDCVPSSLDEDGDVEFFPAPAGRSPAVHADQVDQVIAGVEGLRFALGEAMVVR